MKSAGIPDELPCNYVSVDLLGGAILLDAGRLALPRDWTILHEQQGTIRRGTALIVPRTRVSFRSATSLGYDFDAQLEELATFLDANRGDLIRLLTMVDKGVVWFVSTGGGSRPGLEINPRTVRIMGEIGVQIGVDYI